MLKYLFGSIPLLLIILLGLSFSRGNTDTDVAAIRAISDVTTGRILYDAVAEANAMNNPVVLTLQNEVLRLQANNQQLQAQIMAIQTHVPNSHYVILFMSMALCWVGGSLVTFMLMVMARKPKPNRPTPQRRTLHAPVEETAWTSPTLNPDHEFYDVIVYHQQ